MLTENFKNWCDGYFTSFGKEPIYPSIENTISDMRNMGQKAIKFTLEGCLVSLVIKLEAPEKLLITPFSVNMVVDERSRRQKLSLVENQIMNLVTAAKERFSNLHQVETAVPLPPFGKTHFDQKDDYRGWEDMPDAGWHKQAVKLLCEGYTDSEIASKLNISAKTVSNKFSQLRRLYPELVPTRDELRQRGIR